MASRHQVRRLQTGRGSQVMSARAPSQIAGNNHIRRLALCGCCCSSSLSRTAGSAPATSSIFVRLALPVTSVTAWPRTPNAEATAARAAAVAWPSTARALTRTTNAPSCSPPTPGWAAHGLTRTVIRTNPVCPGRRRTGPVSPEGPSRSHLPARRAGQAESCPPGRAVRMQSHGRFAHHDLRTDRAHQLHPEKASR
jgi:hypothetical protein